MTKINSIGHIGRKLALVVCAVFMVSCSGGAEAERVSQMNLQKIENATNAASNSFNAMLRDGRRFGETTRQPQRADLDVFRMALQSTTLDLERVSKLLDSDPSLVEKARNLWVGRVQTPLSEIEQSGMLVERTDPLTSRLGETFGEERIEQDVQRLFKATRRLQDQLGITDDVASTDGP